MRVSSSRTCVHNKQGSVTFLRPRVEGRKEKKSLTAKSAMPAREKKSLTAKVAVDAK